MQNNKFIWYSKARCYASTARTYKSIVSEMRHKMENPGKTKNEIKRLMQLAELDTSKKTENNSLMQKVLLSG